MMGHHQCHVSHTPAPVYILPPPSHTEKYFPQKKAKKQKREKTKTKKEKMRKSEKRNRAGAGPPAKTAPPAGEAKLHSSHRVRHLPPAIMTLFDPNSLIDFAALQNESLSCRWFYGDGFFTFTFDISFEANTHTFLLLFFYSFPFFILSIVTP